MNKIMNYILAILLGIIIGFICDRIYILNHIKEDIELNSREEFRTMLNDEYTDRKIYMYDYLLKEFTGKSEGISKNNDMK